MTVRNIHTFLQRDASNNWNTVPPVPKDKIGNVNCHKFILYILKKISWENMVSGTNIQKEIETDFTFGNIAQSISLIPFSPITSLESLLLFTHENCGIEKTYIGQILDAQTGEMAHSFILTRESENNFICFEKPGFKYPFEISSLEKILTFVNKDGEQSNKNQKWRFVPLESVK